MVLPLTDDPFIMTVSRVFVPALTVKNPLASNLFNKKEREIFPLMISKSLNSLNRL